MILAWPYGKKNPDILPGKQMFINLFTGWGNKLESFLDINLVIKRWLIFLSNESLPSSKLYGFQSLNEAQWVGAKKLNRKKEEKKKLYHKKYSFFF